jgi:molybdopterin molybdotransferase
METVRLAEAAGRVLAADVVSRVDVPGFERAMMDGYALRAADIAGATLHQRLRLKVIGESYPGRPFAGRVDPGEAVCIMTGAPVPDGADAVLPVEQTDSQFAADAAGDLLWAQGEVPPGKHVGTRGEDIQADATVLIRGRKLRPQDVGVLSSIGVSKVLVVRRPKVRMVVTGSELLPPGSEPVGCRVVDSISPMLLALAGRDGGVASCPGTVPDDPDAILEALRAEADVILVSGGSSVGREDHVPALLARHGELAVHGISMRPSSPTGLGRLGHRLVLLLPGNPVSCLCAYDVFAGRAIRVLGGRSGDWPYRSVRAQLARKLVSVVGRLDYARVQWMGERVEPLAISGASILSSATRADGFVLIPADSEGYPPGAEVDVFLYD